MRIAIFGGSFDPIHFGHLWMAELSREEMRFDEVLFVPAAKSPLKPNGPVASNEQRVAMLRLAISGHPSMRVDSREIERGGTSYTVDTVRDLKKERPADELFLLLGTDAFNSLDQWKTPVELLSMITPVVLRRGGDQDADWALIERLAGQDRADEIRSSALQIPMIEISSGEIRAKTRERRSIRYRVPHAVEAFIVAENIYRAD